MSKVTRKKDRSGQRGRRFENEVAALYRLMGYTVQQNIEICQKKVDILASIQIPGSERKHRVIVECKDENINVAQNQRVLQFKGLLVVAREAGLVDSAEIITRRPWSDQAKGFALSAGIELYTFEQKLRIAIDPTNYIDQVIYDFEHFEECIDPDGRCLKNPIIEIMSRSDLYRTYVPLVCRALDRQKPVQLKSLDTYVNEWLADPLHNHLSILGDFGTGKSSFCLHLTYKLAKRYRDDPINARIPLFISLREYAKAISLQQLITDLLLNKYNICINNYALFQRLVESGRFVLIFDGFDEMATKTDRSLTIRNFEELTKAVVAGSKTILTCRTHYFTDQGHVDETLRGGERSQLLQAIRRRPNFQLVELEEFSDEQIQQLLSRYLPDDWQDAWVVIRRNLRDLARRPLLLDMIIKTLPQLLAMDRAVNMVHLYNAYTRLWIEREDWHARMTPEGKQAFMEELAMKMWIDGGHSIRYQDLRAPIRDYFKEQIITRDDLDHFDHDTRTCSFLNRDSNGNYRFIHKSFMEFFVAKTLSKFLSENTIDSSFLKTDFDHFPEICSFVAQLISEDMEAVENLCRWAFDETSILSWNAISILSFLTSLKAEAVAGHLLRFCNDHGLKRGITWVLGELGIKSKDVLTLLDGAVRDPDHPDTWWEAAFALKKLGVVTDPVGRLIETLPVKWTFGAAVNHLKRTVASREKVKVDQRTVVAVVKEHRRKIRSKQLKHSVEEIVMALFSPLDLAEDSMGRRSYYAVWLFGELRMTSVLDRLLPVVNHPQAAVRNMLAEALGKIGEGKRKDLPPCVGSNGLAVLRKLLDDPYYRTRLHAAEAIGKVRAVELLPALKDAFERESLWDVQTELSRAIQRLEHRG